MRRKNKNNKEKVVLRESLVVNKQQNRGKGKNRRKKQGTNGFKGSVKVGSVPISQGTTLMANRNKTSVNKHGVMTLSKSEYIGDVKMNTSSFLCFAAQINPGLKKTFPWLAPIANQYTKYRFKSISFSYITASASIRPGQLDLMVDWNVETPPPNERVEFINSYKTKQTVPWTNTSYRVDMRDINQYRWYFIRSDGETVEDIKTYDCLNFYVGNVGIGEGPETMGNLWINYTIELSEPMPIRIQELAFANSFGMTWFHAPTPATDIFGPFTDVGTVGGLPIKLNPATEFANGNVEFLTDYWGLCTYITLGLEEADYNGVLGVNFIDPTNRSEMLQLITNLWNQPGDENQSGIAITFRFFASRGAQMEMNLGGLESELVEQKMHFSMYSRLLATAQPITTEMMSNGKFLSHAQTKAECPDNMVSGLIISGKKASYLFGPKINKKPKKKNIID